MRCVLTSSRFSRIVLPLLASASLVGAGCAGLDSPGVGTGGYLQLIEGGAVVFEMETAISGMQSCPQTAHSWIRDDPSLAGRLKCVGSAASEPLPFSVLLRSTRSSEDGYVPAAAYRIRTSTSARCKAVLNGNKSSGTTAIVEDKCGA